MQNGNGQQINVGDKVFSADSDNIKTGTIHSFSYEAGYVYTKEGNTWDVYDLYLSETEAQAKIDRRMSFRNA